MNPTKHAVQQFPKTFDYVKEQDVLDIPETYTTIAQLVVPYREVGVYKFSMAMLYILDLANKSVFFRYRFNGGSWYETIAEPKDKTDQITADYYYPVEWRGGELLVEFEARKEDGSGTLDILYFDAMWERKG